MKNLEVVKILNQIADLLDIKGIEFKPSAYRKASRTIESLNKNIEDIAKQGKLKDLPGIGQGISKKIIEIIETGTCKEFEDLKKSIPIDYESLLAVEGLGPKSVKVLYKKLNIKNLNDLEKAAKKGIIKKLEGFGEKSENQILEGIDFAKSSGKRFLLGHIYDIALSIENQLKNSREVTKVSLAGSIKRMKETIGDIDILVTSKDPKKTMDLFVNLKDAKDIISKGPTRSSIRLNSGIQVDLRVVKEDEFGSALQYFTGNKEHNVITRKIAISKGYKLNEYGLFKDNKKIAGKDEKEIYNKLGLDYIEPELRENTEEIESAKKHNLPKLINYNDIKGDLQMHTNFSDGNDTIEAMAKKAKELGYEYIAITDHVGNLSIANPLTEKRIDNYLKAIEKAKTEIKIFKGCEVNIKPNGDLDLKNDILKKFDFVVASVHLSFKQEKDLMTKRILKAMDNKYVKVLGHPTGRLINARKGYELDLEKLFKKSNETNVILEINAQPERLDLKDVDVKNAVENKCKLIISTDAHNTNSLNYMKFGIATARRGWAEKKDIVNTLSLTNFKKFFDIS